MKKCSNGKKCNKSQNKSRKPFSLEGGFEMDEVHLHLTCKCIFHPLIKFDKEKGIFSVPAPHTCPVCGEGKLIELVLGGVSTEVGKCPHPGCDCNELVAQIPYQQFMYFLQKGRE